MKSRFDFKWDAPTIKYLGVWIPKDISKIFKTNYDPVIKTIKADLNRWTVLPLDMSNRIEMIKMNVLPRLLYLFQSLSVEVPPKDFRKWNRMISTLVWNSKKPN